MPYFSTRQLINFKHFTQLTFARYEIFDLLDTYGKVLYIDVDVMIGGDLSYIFDKVSDDMYLRLTEKGEIEVYNFERKHKTEYTKKEPHRKAQIVEIK